MMIHNVRVALVITGLTSLLFCLPVKAAYDLKGVWHLQDRKNAHASLNMAIEKAVEGMTYFVRRKATSILEDEAQVCYNMTLALTRMSFIWQCDSQKARRISVRANKQISKNADQEEITTTYRKGKRFSSITVESKFATYTHVWTLISERHLEYKATIQYKNIPRPLKWTLIYSKVMR
ncbi:hypothetical protein CBF23_007540 [Marinomonas agarivorans]|nr:hypothetical protein CBF23_007540 [Marinomonas agarivorans]